MWGEGGGFNSFICKLVIGSRRCRRRHTDIIYIYIYLGTSSGGVGSSGVFAGWRERKRDGQTMTECQRLEIRGVLPLLHEELYYILLQMVLCVCVRVCVRVRVRVLSRIYIYIRTGG